MTKPQQSFSNLHASAKANYEYSLVHNFVTTKDPRIFQFIQNFPKSRDLPPQLYDDSTSAVTDNSKQPLATSILFLVTKVLLCLILPPPDNPLNSINFTVQEVFDALTELNPHKASGIDNIPPIVLKRCAQTLTAPIHHLFTSTFNSGSIPTEWKTQDCPSI